MNRIYRNLHSNTWTVQHYVPGKGWRKLESVETLYATSAKFTVSDAGRLRARRERRKNVHAFATVISYRSDFPDCSDDMRYGISYTPYDEWGFRTVDGGGRNLTTAGDCYFGSSGHIFCNKYKDTAGWARGLELNI